MRVEDQQEIGCESFQAFTQGNQSLKSFSGLGSGPCRHFRNEDRCMGQKEAHRPQGHPS